METPTLHAEGDRQAQPRIPPHDIALATPEDGDIVVREEIRGGTAVLHIAPGGDQDAFRRREEGIAQALPLGERHHVRVWLSDEGYDFVLLEDFRMVESV
jgi:hypothetical protein